MKSRLFLFCLLAMMLVKTTYAEKNIGEEVLTDEATAEILKELHSSKPKEEPNTATDSNPPVANESVVMTDKRQKRLIPAMSGAMVSSSPIIKSQCRYRCKKKEKVVKHASINHPKNINKSPNPQDESDDNVDDNALSMQLLFESNSSKLTETAQEQLKPFGKALASDTSDSKFTIEGHTDAAGDDFYNIVLSQERAESVKNYFVAAGANPSRFTTVGKGKANLRDPSNPMSKVNRRVRLIAIN